MNNKWISGLMLGRMIVVVIIIALFVAAVPFAETQNVWPEAAAQSPVNAAAVPAASSSPAWIDAGIAKPGSSSAPESRVHNGADSLADTTLTSTFISALLTTPSTTSTTPPSVSTVLTAPTPTTPSVSTSSTSTAGSTTPTSTSISILASGPSAAVSAAATLKSQENSKVVYLTFDDGPSKLTDEVLAILRRADVPATFFLLGEQAKRYPEVVNRINEAGHAIGNHTYNHKYDALYSSFGEFWSQIKETEEVLRKITGSRTPLVRAPGGTYGHFDKNYFNLLEQGGYKVFDWNLDSGDSKRKGVPASEILENITSAKQGQSMNVLMHDGAGHEQTVKALPKIIEFYKSRGYEFRALTPDDSPVQFAVAPSMKNSKRPVPSSAWIQTHVVPNAALFMSGSPLFVEAGNVETRLETGEYELRDSQYRVPLRTLMERLGAEVRWNDKEQAAVVSWRDAIITIHTVEGTMRIEAKGSAAVESTVTLDRKNGLIWLPLRSLLEAAGHDVLSVTVNQDERRVRAL